MSLATSITRNTTTTSFSESFDLSDNLESPGTAKFSFQKVPSDSINMQAEHNLLQPQFDPHILATTDDEMMDSDSETQRKDEDIDILDDDAYSNLGGVDLDVMYTMEEDPAEPATSGYENDNDHLMLDDDENPMFQEPEKVPDRASPRVDTSLPDSVQEVPPSSDPVITDDVPIHSFAQSSTPSGAHNSSPVSTLRPPLSARSSFQVNLENVAENATTTESQATLPITDESVRFEDAHTPRAIENTPHDEEVVEPEVEQQHAGNWSENTSATLGHESQSLEEQRVFEDPNTSPHQQVNDKAEVLPPIPEGLPEESEDPQSDYHPVLIQWRNKTVNLGPFPPKYQSEDGTVVHPFGNLPDEYFTDDAGIYALSFDELFLEFRETVNSAIGTSVELYMEFDQLEFAIGEDNINCKSIYLQQVIDLFYQLQLQDGYEIPDPLHITLKTTPRILNHLHILWKLAEEGKGIGEAMDLVGTGSSDTLEPEGEGTGEGSLIGNDEFRQGERELQGNWGDNPTEDENTIVPDDDVDKLQEEEKLQEVEEEEEEEEEGEKKVEDKQQFEDNQRVEDEQHTEVKQQLEKHIENQQQIEDKHQIENQHRIEDEQQTQNQKQTEDKQQIEETPKTEDDDDDDDDFDLEYGNDKETIEKEEGSEAGGVMLNTDEKQETPVPVSTQHASPESLVEPTDDIKTEVTVEIFETEEIYPKDAELAAEPEDLTPVVETDSITQPEDNQLKEDQREENQLLDYDDEEEDEYRHARQASYSAKQTPPKGTVGDQSDHSSQHSSHDTPPQSEIVCDDERQKAIKQEFEQDAFEPEKQGDGHSRAENNSPNHQGNEFAGNSSGHDSKPSSIPVFGGDSEGNEDQYTDENEQLYPHYGYGDQEQHFPEGAEEAVNEGYGPDHDQHHSPEIIEQHGDGRVDAYQGPEYTQGFEGDYPVDGQQYTGEDGEDYYQGDGSNEHFEGIEYADQDVEYQQSSGEEYPIPVVEYPEFEDGSAQFDQEQFEVVEESGDMSEFYPTEDNHQDQVPGIEGVDPLENTTAYDDYEEDILGYEEEPVKQLPYLAQAEISVTNLSPGAQKRAREGTEEDGDGKVDDVQAAKRVRAE